jgi:hypothetical protein
MVVPLATGVSGNDDYQRASGRREIPLHGTDSFASLPITPDKQNEFATVAQAEGVSLSVARRLLRVVAGSRSTPSVPTLGRATLEAGVRAGGLLEVLDEATRPEVEQGIADEIFSDASRS